MDPALLLAVAKRAGLPAVAVKMPTEDRASWVIEMTTPTRDQQATAAALIATFDPSAAPVREAVAEAQAQAMAASRQTRAFFLWWFRVTNRREPTPEETAEASAALVQAYKDASP